MFVRSRDLPFQLPGGFNSGRNFAKVGGTVCCLSRPFSNCRSPGLHSAGKHFMLIHINNSIGLTIDKFSLQCIHMQMKTVSQFRVLFRILVVVQACCS